MKLRLALLVFLGLGACAGATGYDPARYETSAAPPASSDPDVEPLPIAKKRPKRLDARSPLDASP